jgi:hypothetical protein
MSNHQLARSPRIVSLALAALAMLALPGCAAIADIFKAGVWVGVLAIIGLVVVVGGLMALLRKK